MKLTVEQAEDFLTFPEDTLIQVSVANVETREVAARNGKEGWTSLNFKFTVIGMPTALEPAYGSMIGSPIWGSTSARLTSHPDNKLRQWAEALLDIGELESGFELDTEMLIGRKARGQVGLYTKTGLTAVSQKIIGLLPLNAVEQKPAFAGFAASDDAPF